MVDARIASSRRLSAGSSRRLSFRSTKSTASILPKAEEQALQAMGKKALRSKSFVPAASLETPLTFDEESNCSPDTPETLSSRTTVCVSKGSLPETPLVATRTEGSRSAMFESVEPPVQSLQVAVRLRPLNSRELEGRSTKRLPSFRRRNSASGDAFPYAWTVQRDDKTATIVPNTKSGGKCNFTFDHVFEESQSTQTIYQEIGHPIVQAVVEGKHGTIFAYGQTGSGKTYTMQGSDDERGIIALATQDLFDLIQQTTDREFTVRATHIEIYNEKVRDLLATHTICDNGKTELPLVLVREDMKRKGAVQISSIQKVVDSTEQVMELLTQSSKNRVVASTDMNERSSRSHAIFQLTVESRSGGLVRDSVLNLVDLAGSESGASNTGSRLREGGKINQSLLSLSQVVHSLSLPPNQRPKYINYRDSKLTRILQAHLSGNAVMAVLCCATPSRLFVEETRSTLRFASRAKLVKTQAQVNEATTREQDKAFIKELLAELEVTRKALRELREQQERMSETSSKQTENGEERRSSTTESAPVPVLLFRDGPDKGEPKSIEEASRSVKPASAVDASDKADAGAGAGAVPSQEEPAHVRLELYLARKRKERAAAAAAAVARERKNDVDTASRGDSAEDECSSDPSAAADELVEASEEESAALAEASKEKDAPDVSCEQAVPTEQDIYENKGELSPCASVTIAEPSGDSTDQQIQGKDMVPNEEQEEIGQAEPSGDSPDQQLQDEDMVPCEEQEKIGQPVNDTPFLKVMTELLSSQRNLAQVDGLGDKLAGGKDAAKRSESDTESTSKDDEPELMPIVKAKLGIPPQQDTSHVADGTLEKEVADTKKADRSEKGRGATAASLEMISEIDLSALINKPMEYGSSASATSVGGVQDGLVAKAVDNFRDLVLKRGVSSGEISSSTSSGPPSEVFVVSNVPFSGDDVDLQARLDDAEELVRFLQAKLEATTDLVDTTSTELEKAKICIEALMQELRSVRNAGGFRNTEGLSPEEELFKRQYALLKFGMYAGLAFFVVGQREMFLVAAIFLWLLIEVMV